MAVGCLDWRKFRSSPGKSFRKNLKSRGEAGRLSRLVENRSEGPEFEQWDAQRGCCRPRPPSIYFPFESFREFSARQRPRVRGPGLDPRPKPGPSFLDSSGKLLTIPSRGARNRGKTLYCRQAWQRFRTMALVNGAVWKSV